MNLCLASLLPAPDIQQIIPTVTGIPKSTSSRLANRELSLSAFLKCARSRKVIHANTGPYGMRQHNGGR
eukprot:31357-Eustigmatos_ZCMA.PRE.1